MSCATLFSRALQRIYVSSSEDIYCAEVLAYMICRGVSAMKILLLALFLIFLPLRLSRIRRALRRSQTRCASCKGRGSRTSQGVLNRGNINNRNWLFLVVPVNFRLQIDTGDVPGLRADDSIATSASIFFSLFGWSTYTQSLALGRRRLERY